VHTEGNCLAVFDLDQPERPVYSEELHSGHGVVWDEPRGILWALGYAELRAYRLRDWESAEPKLERVGDHRFPGTSGHDLAEVPGTDDLVLTTHEHVLLFDREKKTFRLHPELGHAAHVKGISIHPITGHLLAVQAEGQNWWASRVRTLNPEGELLLPGERLYKARWNVARRPAFGRGVFLSPEKLAALRESVTRGDEPASSAFLRLSEEAAAGLKHEPQPPERWHVPAFYRDAEGHRKAKRGLEQDANTAYTLALYFQMTGGEAHARAAARLIDAWTTGVKSFSREDDSTLSFSYHFPAMIFAADLLRDWNGWPEASREAFKQFVREKALPMNTSAAANNWGNWGLVLLLSAAAHLEDADLFERGVGRWKEFIERQIAPDGHLPHDVGRNNGRGERGIWYSHFTLMPQTIAAEIALVNGVDLYEYESPGGRTLRLAFERLAPWAREPATFPYFKGTNNAGQLGTDYINYFEVLNARWPNPDAAAMLRERRPVRASHCAPHLTFTHGADLEHPSPNSLSK
jgi:hypothetical protein